MAVPPNRRPVNRPLSVLKSILETPNKEKSECIELSLCNSKLDNQCSCNSKKSYESHKSLIIDRPLLKPNIL